MNTCHQIILSLGSNCRKEANIEEAIHLLQACFLSLRFSEPVVTEPIRVESTGERKTKEISGGTGRRETREMAKAIEAKERGERKEVKAIEAKERGERKEVKAMETKERGERKEAKAMETKERGERKEAKVIGGGITEIEPVSTQAEETTGPEGCFLNCVAIGGVAEDAEQIGRILKAIERRLGRRPDDKAAGRIPIDIDLLQWDEQVLKPDDLSRPYVVEGLSALRLSADQA